MVVGRQLSDLSPRVPTPVPEAAAWLGAFGAIPFVALAVIALIGGDWAAASVVALALYGAVILSFLGGVHWGLAVAGFGNGPLVWRLRISVVPSLVGWGAVLLPASAGLIVLAAAFAAVLAIDVRAARVGAIPGWYLRLRWPLTAVVMSALLLGAVASGGG